MAEALLQGIFGRGTEGSVETRTSKSLNQVRDGLTKRGKGSAFHVNITNTLGVNANNAKAKLKNWALSDPAGYTAFRNKVYTGVISFMVQRNYDIIWDLLADGKYKDLDGNDAQMKIGASEDEYSPELADPEIARLANGFAEAVLKAFDEIVGTVLPDNYKELAESKMIAVNKSNGKGGLME